jgi:hypothetical protein
MFTIKESAVCNLSSRYTRLPIPVHIYPLSRLVHASAGAWESELRAIEEGKLHAYRYYLPLREAVVAYCKNGGKKRDQILNQLSISASAVGAARGANPLKDNRAGFDVFVSSFYPRIGTFGQSFLREDTKQGCAFEGVTLGGLPHFSTTDSKGDTRYVYVHASKWDDDDLKCNGSRSFPLKFSRCFPPVLSV